MDTKGMADWSEEFFITCEATGFVLAYFTVTSKEKENLPILQDAITWLHIRYNLHVKVVRADREFLRKETSAWLRQSGISVEGSIPYAHEQNGLVERIGRLIMTKSH